MAYTAPQYSSIDLVKGELQGELSDDLTDAVILERIQAASLEIDDTVGSTYGFVYGDDNTQKFPNYTTDPTDSAPSLIERATRYLAAADCWGVIGEISTDDGKPTNQQKLRSTARGIVTRIRNGEISLSIAGQQLGTSTVKPHTKTRDKVFTDQAMKNHLGEL